MEFILGANDSARLCQGLIPKKTARLLHVAKTELACSDFRFDTCRGNSGKILQKPHGRDASTGLALAILKLSHSVFK